MPAFPTEYLTSGITWSDESVQSTMEAGSEIHRVTIGFDPIVTKGTARWVAPPAYVTTLRNTFVVADNLIGIYSFEDPVLGTVILQPDGPFTWTQSSMSRWVATLPVRIV